VTQGQWARGRRQGDGGGAAAGVRDPNRTRRFLVGLVLQLLLLLFLGDGLLCQVLGRHWQGWR